MREEREEGYEREEREASERDGKVLEQLGVHRILQFPAVGLDFAVSVPCIRTDGIQAL